MDLNRLDRASFTTEKEALQLRWILDSQKDPRLLAAAAAHLPPPASRDLRPHLSC